MRTECCVVAAALGSGSGPARLQPRCTSLLPSMAPRGSAAPAPAPLLLLPLPMLLSLLLLPGPVRAAAAATPLLLLFLLGPTRSSALHSALPAHLIEVALPRLQPSEHR